MSQHVTTAADSHVTSLMHLPPHTRVPVVPRQTRATAVGTRGGVGHLALNLVLICTVDTKVLNLEIVFDLTWALVTI